MFSLHDLLQQRYGAAHPRALDELNDTLALLLQHRSVRAYRPDPLAPGTLELLVTAAQSASTSSNLQTWSVVAVEDAARRARIAGWCGGQRHIVEAPLFLAWIADLARLQAVAEAAGLPSGALDHLELFLVAVIDAALAAQNAVVAAESLGLGTVYIGALRNRPEEVARELKLPPRTFAVFGLVVGWPDPAQPAAVKPRLSQAAILHREHYSDNGLAGAITDYDHTMGAFYASQQMEPQSWTKHSLGRVAGGESIGNRARLREILGRLGFPLR